MDSATDANDNNKRARVGKTRTKPPLSRPHQPSTAVQMARMAASVTIASLPTAIKSLASKYHQQFLQLRIDLRILETTESRLAKDDFEPHSTRFKFDLKASTRVKEQAGNEFTTLASRADLALNIFKCAAKRQIVALVELEIKTLKTAIAKLFCQAIGTLAIASCIHHPTVEGAHKAPVLVYLVFERHHRDLLRFSELSPRSPQDFFDLFQEVHPVPQGVHQHATLDLGETYAVESAEASFKDLIDALFCRSWLTYLHAKEDILRQLELQEFVEGQLKEQATAPVAMEVDLITTDSPELAEAVKAQVAQSTKSLQAQVSRLTNKLNELKNMPSGAPKSRAQPKKKKDPTLQAVKQPPAASKAAVDVNDLPASKPRPAPGKSRKQRKKKNKPKNSSS
jgi:hypothetical protein